MTIDELIKFIESLPNRKEGIKVTEIEVSFWFASYSIEKEVIHKIIKEVPFDFYIMDGGVYFQR